MEINVSVCGNVSVDLSPSSLELTSNGLLLLVIIVISCIISAFTIIANIITGAALYYSRSPRGSALLHAYGISDNTKMLMSSFCAHHVIIGGLCMPMGILTIAGNGRWHLGSVFCSARIYAETLAEIVGVYHVLAMSIDTFLAVNKPLTYRLLTRKYGYAMLALCWLTPVVLFSLPNVMGGYQQGVEDISQCFALNNICLPVYGKNVLFFALLVVDVIPFFIVIVIYFRILWRITKFHKRRSKRQNFIDNFHFSDLKIDPPTNLNANNQKDRDLALKYEKFQMSTGGKTISDKDLRSCKLNNNEIYSMDMSLSKYNQQNVDNGSAVSNRTVSKLSEMTRKWKAFPYMITMATWHGTYWFSIIIGYLYFAHNTSKLPVWSILLFSWLCYLNSLVNPIFMFCNTSVRNIIKEAMKNFRYT